MILCKAKCHEMPVVRKCCFCMPIRRGVVLFGYVNLVLSLLSLPLLVVLLVDQISSTAVQDYNENLMDPRIHLPLTIASVVVDVVMTVILLIGAHKKRIILLRVYLYFGVVLQLLTLCVDLVYFDKTQYIENIIYFVFLSLNIYLLFLVHHTVRVIEEESTEVKYVACPERQTL